MANIYPGEKGFKIQATIKDEDGVAVNLTGATIEFQIYDPLNALIIKSVTIDNGTGGVCSYTTTDQSDFLTPGRYKIQPKITLSNGNIFYGSSQSMEITALGK